VSAAAPSEGFWQGTSVVVTGGAGFLGGAVMTRLAALGADARLVRSAEHDLRDPAATRAAVEGAEIVVHLAARVGGIGFNRRNPGPLVYDNLMMTGNIFEQSRLAGVRKLVSACTVCAYPKFTPVPFKEDDLWNGYPEESNAPYGLAKKMMLVLSDAYRRQYGFDSCAPIVANLYGPNDNFDLMGSHVLPALIRKFHEAKVSGQDEVVVWGSGQVYREFLHVDDMADACVFVLKHYDGAEILNIGCGQDVTIAEVAQLVKETVGYEGEITFDRTKPDGSPRKLLDVSRLFALGWRPQIGLPEGLAETYAWYLRHLDVGRGLAVGV
jgi:GDP-L-fucose synthase